MNLIAKMMQGLAATGRHRAVDRVPVLEAQLAATQAKLAWADALITKVCREKSALLFENARLTAEKDTATEANGLLEVELDELGARLIEARQDLANALAVSAPAPADLDDTVETNVTTLRAAHGLRPAA